MTPTTAPTAPGLQQEDQEPFRHDGQQAPTLAGGGAGVPVWVGRGATDDRNWTVQRVVLAREVYGSETIT